jgi:hypothetical protein
MEDNNTPILITGLTHHEVDLLHRMWEIDSTEDFELWEVCLEENDRETVSRLQRMIILELGAEILNAEVEATKYKEAKSLLKKFTLKKKK